MADKCVETSFFPYLSFSLKTKSADCLPKVPATKSVTVATSATCMDNGEIGHTSVE